MDRGPALSGLLRDYSGTSLSLTGQVLNQSRALIKAGLEAKFNNRPPASAAYNLELGENTSAHSISAGINFKF